MKEECLLHLEHAADVFISSERREPRRFEKAILAVSMALPAIRVKDDPERFNAIPNLDALLRFKASLSDLHHRIATGQVEPTRRLTEVIMAMGYDHLTNYFLGYHKQELFEELPQSTINVFTSVRRKVGSFVRDARTKLQEALASGAYRIHFCRSCSSQAFIFPKVVPRDHMKMPDIRGECYLCQYQGKVRVCASCTNPFFPSAAATVDGTDDPGETRCGACRTKGEAES